jgi:HEAT repeat protein
MLKQTGALPAARRCAQQAEGIPLRMAALATIGDIGAARDADLLREMTADAQPYVRKAAASALRRLEQRLQGGTQAL